CRCGNPCSTDRRVRRDHSLRALQPPSSASSAKRASPSLSLLVLPGPVQTAPRSRGPRPLRTVFQRRASTTSRSSSVLPGPEVGSVLGNIHLHLPVLIGCFRGVLRFLRDQVFPARRLPAPEIRRDLRVCCSY